MIIETPKLTRKLIFLRKNGFKLYESNKLEEKNTNLPNILFKNNITISEKENNDEINNKKRNTLKTYKKKLFLDNILSTEKTYFIEDYILNKESKLLKYRKFNNNKYQLRKTIFSEGKIDACRTSYFSKETRDNYNIRKIPIMMKDIDTNLIVMKNDRNKRYKDYMKRKLEMDLYENKYYEDFNNKLGIKNIYIKTENYFNNKNKKGVINDEIKFFTLKNFKTFKISYNSMKNKKLKSKVN